MTQKEKESCLSVKQTSQRLGISEKTVRRLVASGELPAVKIRSCLLVKESDLVAFISDLPNVVS
jgi:excisionase family DNA binding protein